MMPGPPSSSRSIGSRTSIQCHRVEAWSPFQSRMLPLVLMVGRRIPVDLHVAKDSMLFTKALLLQTFCIKQTDFNHMVDSFYRYSPPFIQVPYVVSSRSGIVPECSSMSKFDSYLPTLISSNKIAPSPYLRGYALRPGQLCIHALRKQQCSLQDELLV